MTVPCPSLQWPSGLLEVGPAEDPSILLRSVAQIGGAAYSVMAIRMDPIRLQADLRGDLPTRTYAECQVAQMLDDIAVYAEITDGALVHLATGDYVMIVLPAGDAGGEADAL